MNVDPKSLNVSNEYVEIMMRNLKHTFPLLSDAELMEAIRYSIDKRYRSSTVIMHNNYENIKRSVSTPEVLHFLETEKPVMTSSGMLYKNAAIAENPLSDMIMGYIKSRKIFKKEMFKYPKGSEMFEKYNLMQLLKKRDANATYGALGSPTCMYYNIYTAESITRQGRSYISCSIMLFESFLGNNVKFNNLDEIITFIDNVSVKDAPSRQFNDFVVLDRGIAPEEVFYKLCINIDSNIWIPTNQEMDLLWDIVINQSWDNLNRLYYKNNLYTFCELPYVSNLIIKILCELEEPFMDPNNPPEEIQDDLDLLTDLLFEYVYYGYFPIDKLDRIEYMQRDIVCISDTDSTIISFDAWYNFVLNMVFYIDMNIKTKDYKLEELVDASNEGRKPVSCGNRETYLEYDFYTDEFIEKTKGIEMCDYIPQEGLQYSIINMMGYICTRMVTDYLDRYCKLSGSYVEGRTCSLVMKNEFLFSRILLTNKRRNYADKQLLQEGHPVAEEASMAIMGLPINKTTLSEGIKHDLQKILYDEVLSPRTIDPRKIMNELVKMEKTIITSIMNGESTFYKPDNVASQSSYAAPMSQNGIKAIVAYNELRDDTMPPINLDERNNIYKVKVNITPKNVDKIKETYPQTYAKMVKLLEEGIVGKKIDTVGFLRDTPTPEWLLPFVDVQGIVSDNLHNFPLDSIGLQTLDNSSISYSNIIQL